MENGKFVIIYDSMLTNEKWVNLPTTAKLLYVFIKAEWIAEETVEPKWVELVSDLVGCCVRFNYGVIKEKYFGKRDYGTDRFNCDLTALVNGGFIEFVETENNDNGTTYIVLLSPKWHTNQSLISEPYIDGITASEWRKSKTNQIMIKLAKKIQHDKCTCGEPLGDDFHALRQANTTFGSKKVMYELLCPKCYERRKVNGRIRPTQEL